MASSEPSEQTERARRARWPVLLFAAIAAVVVLCVVTGVIAAIAVPAFMTYVKRSKAAEATTNLRSLGDRAVAYCDAQGELPPAAGPLPVEIPGDEAVSVDFSEDPSFENLGFTGSKQVYYSYLLEHPSPDTARIVARGDLDADGTASHFELTCTADPCHCDEALTIQNELE